MTDDSKREWLRARLAEAGLDATNLARRIGRSKEFVSDYLKKRKLSMNAEDWAAIERELGQTTEAGLAPGDVLAALEVLLELLTGSDIVAREAAQLLLTVISDRQSLPAGVSRDSAVRLAVHEIARRSSKRLPPASH